ncbi:MAG: transposase, partial [Actinomycetota bacterium]|nr:transposase [Actinomycetota bacterium]
ALDGIYVLRTSLPAAELSPPEVVSSYKALSHVERAFRAFNTDLDIRPIRHRTEERVRAHVFARMLSYYVTLHMERALAPMLFRDDDHEAAEAPRKETPEHLAVHSFATLLSDLATIAANRIAPTGSGLEGFTLITTPTPVQSRAFDLLGVSHRLGYV